MNVVAKAPNTVKPAAAAPMADTKPATAEIAILLPQNFAKDCLYLFKAQAFHDRIKWLVRFGVDV